MTKKKEAEIAEAIATLKKWGVTEGITIYAQVKHVSASGMFRRVQLLHAMNGEIIDISYYAAIILDWGKYTDGYKGGIPVHGCGMDMLFHTVYSLSCAMGYVALNQGEREANTNGLIYKQI